MDEPDAVTGPTASSLAQFPWVTKRDGRLVPFEADKISRVLFAVTERLGHADAFLARELTDAVLHFLAAEADGTIPTTSRVAETVIKVVRELGYAPMAQAFAEAGRARAPDDEKPLPLRHSEHGDLLAEVSQAVEAALPAVELARRVSRAALRQYSLGAVFGRDLVAAHADGLLHLGHLESPLELSAAVLVPPITGHVDPSALGDDIEEARNHVGDLLAFDAPEHALFQSSEPLTAASDYAHALRSALRATGLNGVVNLNIAKPPAWAGEVAEGPLFAGQRRPPDLGALARTADALLDALALPLAAENRVRVDWHLGERDFQPEGAPRLVRLARRLLEGGAIAFVFDRPRRPVPLAEGLDRQNPAALFTVGVSLPRLAEQPGIDGDAERWLEKLGSLVRMALSAAGQKRDFLRRYGQGRPALTRGFLLQRARLVVAPLGLEAVTRRFLGRSLAETAGVEFARRVVQRLRAVLRADGAAHHLDTCLDAPASFRLDEPARLGILLSLDKVPGVTGWDATPPARQQLRSAGQLHAIAERGTAAVLIPAEHPVTADEIADLLRHAWQKTEVVRVRFVRLPPAAKQLTAPWDVE